MAGLLIISNSFDFSDIVVCAFTAAVPNVISRPLTSKILFIVVSFYLAKLLLLLHIIDVKELIPFLICKNMMS